MSLDDAPPSTQRLPTPPPTRRMLIALAIESAASDEDARAAVAFALESSGLIHHVNDAYFHGHPFAHCVGAVARLDTLTCCCCGLEAPRAQMTIHCEDGGECDARRERQEGAT